MMNLNKLQFIFLALLSGTLLGVAWPGTGGITPFVFIGFVPLLYLEHKISNNNADKVPSLFWLSYIAFFIWNLIATWWVYCVDEELITKLVSIGAPVLINPLFMAFTFNGFSRIKKRLGEKQGYFSFILFWLTFEYIHLNWELSYPWLSLGNIFATRVAWVQWYEYTGVFGGSLWILLTNLFVFYVVKAMAGKPDNYKTKTILNGTLMLLILAIPLFLSYQRYNSYNEKQNSVDITVVQPNIDPYNIKFSKAAEDQIQLFTDLARKETTRQTDYVLGPETALPYSIWISEIKESDLYQLLKSFGKDFPKANLVLGASLGKIYHTSENLPITARKFSDVNKWFDHFNSAIQIDLSDSIQVYHKSKLVLGVEMMPFPSVFQRFQEVIFDLGGTTGSLGTQKERGVFQSGRSDTKIAPVICWESVYGEYVGDYILNGANLIFILTNDGWWGETPGHVQHFQYGRLRAIETRRSIARSANTGISCFINQRGDVIKQTKWWEPTAISDKLNSNDTITFYSLYGDFIARISAFLTFLLVLWSYVRRFSNKGISLK